MVNFNFDNVERRAYQEPQTTKRELLRPPPQSANNLSNGDWHTPSGPAGISDLLANQATWTFNDIDKHAVAPAKVETVLPMVRSEKRQRDEEPLYGPSTKKQSKDKKDESSRAAEDEDGEMDVIDLTSDVEDNNEQTIFPERQFVPRAHDDSRTTQRRKSPSPPRTFIRGFSPIAAHPRKPPIVNKSKPPIKPPHRRQRRTTQSSTSSSHQVFRVRASMSSTRSEPQPGTPIARSTPTVTLDSRSPKGPSTTGTSTCGPPRKSGPFLQEEDSDSEGEAATEDRQVTRHSVENLVNRPKHDTPARLELARLQGASQDMRVAARDKTHKGLITPAISEKNPDGADQTDAAPSDPKPSKTPAPETGNVAIPSIEDSPKHSRRDLADETHSSLVRHRIGGLPDVPHKRTTTTAENNRNIYRPSQKRSNANPFFPPRKSGAQNAYRNNFQAMCQKARLQNAKHNMTTPASTAGSLANSGSQNTHAQSLRREVTIERAERTIATNKLKRPSTQILPRQAATGSDQGSRVHTQHFRDLNDQLAPLERDSQETDDAAEASPVEKPSGPFALNSAHGVQAIRKVVPKTITHPYEPTSSSATAARFMGKKPPKPPKVTIKKKAHNSLRIVASDLQLYKWRQQGLPWSKVGGKYEQLPETTFHSEDRMRKRFRFVEESIETEEISEELCQRVIDGEEGAEEELNRLVGLKAPEKAAPLDTRPFRKITKGDAADAKPAVAASHASTPHPQTLVAPRPTQGGKTIDYESSQVYFAHVANLLKEDAETEAEDTDRECSPITDQDQVHWEYFLERRDFDVEELTEELMENELASVEDMEWREYGVTREKLWDANALASRFVLATPEGEELFTAGQNFSLRQERDDNGMVLLTRESELGTTQVRVCRRLLTFQQHIVPESKDGWLPKVMYCVQVKIINKPQDDLFDSLDVTLKTLDDEIYGSLAQAKSRAIAEWVKLTLKPMSARLKQVEIELAEARAALSREVEDEGDDTVFRRFIEDDEKSVEVFVQAVKVKGPRN